MNIRIWFKSPSFFVSFSFGLAVLNFLASFFSLVYFWKTVFFIAQAVSFLMFILSVRFVQNPVFSGLKLSRYFDVHTVLFVVVILLYVDFKLTAFAGISTANVFLELAFYLAYLFALSGTCFWFALELSRKDRWRWLSIVFILIGLTFSMVFLDSMFYWSQNYVYLVFPSQLSLVALYAPHILMFLAALSTVAIVFRQTSMKNSPFSFRLAFLLFVPAFFIPLIWDSYKEGLINFVIRDIIYYGLGYSSKEWYAVSFYLMSFVAYVLTLRELSRRSDHTLAFSLIVLGVASFPWNGVVPLNRLNGYSSVPGNVISLNSIITGALLLTSQRGMK